MRDRLQEELAEKEAMLRSRRLWLARARRAGA
jgi:hypothetical protein